MQAVVGTFDRSDSTRAGGANVGAVGSGMGQLRAWLAAVAVACCLVAAAVAVNFASAASAATPTWTGLTTVSGGDPSIGAQAIPDPVGGGLLYYSAYGAPTVQRVLPDGSLGPFHTIPHYQNLSVYGTPGKVAFLPDGAAIVTWTLSSSGQDYMAYLSPGGVWGAPVKIAGVASIAVRPGEVLTSQGGGGGITADDWTLSSSGTLTHHSGPTTVFTGQPLFGQSWVALDNSGSATVLSYGYTSANANEEVYQTIRSAHGVWGAATSLSGTAGTIQNVVFAAAPGGRAVVAWQDRTSPTAPVMSAAIRVPGAGFDAAHAFSSPTSTYFAFALPIAAAGSDGTLALGASNEIGTGPAGSSYTTTNSVWLAPAGAAAFSGAKTVTGTTNKFLINSLGVVAGAALVGIHEEVITDAPTASYPSRYRATETTTAVRVPFAGAANLTNFGSSVSFFDPNSAENCSDCEGTSPPPASVSGVALGAHGFELATGQLKPGGTLSYAAVRAVAAPPPPAAVPAARITSKRLTAHAKSVGVKVLCSKATCRGTITLTRKVKRKKVTLASAAYSLAAGRRGAVTVKLTKAGRTAFRHAAKNAVTVTVHVSVKGGKTVTKSLRVT